MDDAGGVDPEAQRPGLGGGACGEREDGRAVGDVELDRRLAGARCDGMKVAGEHGEAVGETGIAQGPAEIAGSAGDHRGRHQAAASTAAR
jgi:hypothetical protein